MMKTAPTAAAIHTRLAHSHRNGWDQSAGLPTLPVVGLGTTLRVPPRALLLCAADLAGSATDGKRPVRTRYSAPKRGLAELNRNVAGAVCGNYPDGPYIVVRAQDVRPVTCAVHEHSVELGVIDAARPPADVLPRLVTQAAREVHGGSIRV